MPSFALCYDVAGFFFQFMQVDASRVALYFAYHNLVVGVVYGNQVNLIATVLFPIISDKIV